MPKPTEDRQALEEDMRRRTLSMFAYDLEAVAHFLNRFFFWHGSLNNEAQFSCHNSAETFLIWLMGGKPPENVDQRYIEELEVLLGRGAVDSGPPSGDSYIRDRPRRGRKKA